MYTQQNQYRVVLEADPQFQREAVSLDKIYVKSTNGQQVPLSAIAHFEMVNSSLSVNHQGQFPAVTITFNLAPGIALGQATGFIENAARELGMPSSIHGSFQGTAKVFSESQSTQGLLILAALVAVYIVLGVLYESTIHPVTILSTLPSAGLGALLALLAFGMDLSLVSIIGIILLIGIVKKNAIMMIDFALEAERNEGMSSEESIYQACITRFRPIMMTTMAAMLGCGAAGGWNGHRLGIAAAARRCHCRRPAGLAGVNALHDARDLSLFRAPAPPSETGQGICTGKAGGGWRVRGRSASWLIASGTQRRSFARTCSTLHSPASPCLPPCI